MGGEAVLDKETGLVWERSWDQASYLELGKMPVLRAYPKTPFWALGLPVAGGFGMASYCYQKQVGGRKGWRLPTIEVLLSLVPLHSQVCGRRMLILPLVQTVLSLQF